MPGPGMERKKSFFPTIQTRRDSVDWVENDARPSVTYFSKDPIANFVLQVDIEERFGGSENLTETLKTQELKRRQKERMSLTKTELLAQGFHQIEEPIQDRIISSQRFDWQEKVFSPREMMQYAFDKRKTHQHHRIAIRKMLHPVYPKIRLLENLEDPKLLQEACLRYILEQSGPNRILFSTITENQDLTETVRKFNSDLVVDAFGSTIPLRKSARSEKNVMYVIATFSLPHAEKELRKRKHHVGEEIVLAKIHYLENGQISLQPGLNPKGESKAYVLKLDNWNAGTCTTNYYCVNLSSVLEASARESDKLEQWEEQHEKARINRLNDLRLNSFHSRFTSPANDELIEISFYGEIKRATEFTEDFLGSLRLLLNLTSRMGGLFNEDI